MYVDGMCNNGFINNDGKSESKEANFEKIKRLSFEADEKSQNDLASPEYDPFEHRNIEHPITNNETLVHLLKLALGTGIFSMPNAFHNAGYTLGVIGTVVIGAIATYCVHILVNIQYDLCKSRKVPSMTYPFIGEAALLCGPKSLRKFAPYTIHVINAFLLMYQIGASAVYVIFIADNFKALFDYAFEINVNSRLIMLVILLPLILASWIRDLKYLAPLAIIGNGLAVASFAVIWYYVFREPLTLDGKRPYATISEFPQFFGTVVFALEAIGVIMPLENEMKRPSDFRGPTGVLNRAMFLVVALYIGLGLCGYLKYGSNIKPTVTLNLPDHELLAQSAKGMIACGVLITHIISCYVAFNITWNHYFVKRLENHSRKLLAEYALRTAIVCITFMLAVMIPNLDVFISLIGALTLSTLGILFPPFLECCARWHTTSGVPKAWMIFRNSIIGCIGFAGFIIGTSLSIGDIFETYSKKIHT